MAKPERKKINVKRVVEKAKETNTGSISWVNKPGDMRIFKFKKGLNRISILPYTVTKENNPDNLGVGEIWFNTTVKVHMGIGANNEAILCPSNFGKPCPICEHRKALMDEGAEWNSDEVSSLAPRKRQLYYVINEDDDDKSVQLMESSYKNFGELLETEIREDESVGCFADEEDGMILKCRAVEKTFGQTKYVAIDKITFDERDPISLELRDSNPDLHSLLKLLSYTEIYNKLHVGGEEPEPEEAPEPPRKKKPAPVKEEEEEEEIEEVEEETASDDDDEDCAEFGKNCGYNDDICDECDRWKECRKATDLYLTKKRRSKE